MEIAIFGLGYVGSITAVGLAHLGHTVVGVDIHASKVEAMKRGIPPVHEPGLTDLLAQSLAAGCLRVTTDPQAAVDSTTCAIIAVGTPSEADGSTNLEAVQRCIESIGTLLGTRQEATPYAIIIRSTVPPGTTSRMLRLAAELSGRTVGETLLGGMNPEFLREGTALRDFLEPSLIVQGADDPASLRLAEDLYEGLAARRVAVSNRTAELVKYTNNAFHALKICFANEIGRLSEQFGIDGQEVMDVLCMDEKLNISSKYLRPGFAYGGSCLPKDLRALNKLARDNALEIPLLASIATSNETHISAALDRIEQHQPRRVGLLGIAFKEGTDDVRESAALHLARRLCDRGIGVTMYDPLVDRKKLMGTNRRYIEEILPNWQDMLSTSLEEVLTSCDLVALTHSEKSYSEVLQPYLSTHPQLVLVDLSTTSLNPNPQGA